MSSRSLTKSKSVCLSVCLSLCLSVSLSVRLSVSLFVILYVQVNAKNSLLGLNAGGDVVGMSDGHEVLVARHMDIKVLSISLICNMVKL